MTMTVDAWIAIVIAIVAQTVGIASWIIRLGTRISVLENQVAVFWRNVSYDAAKILHSPNPEHWRMDELIERYLDHQLTPDERDELLKRLSEYVDDPAHDTGTRTAASQMRRAIEVANGIGG